MAVVQMAASTEAKGAARVAAEMGAGKAGTVAWVVALVVVARARV